MLQINLLLDRLNNTRPIVRFLPVFCLLFFYNASPLVCQTPIEAIRELPQGTLIIRFPAFKNKIDTLESMIKRSPDNKDQRLQKLLDEALQERDTLVEDYTAAFRENYDFSKVAYFFDYESRDLKNAHYYNIDGSSLSYNQLHAGPVLYLFFTRTTESKIDALVFHDRSLKPLAHPFPNNFSRGGLSFLFRKLSGETFAVWRVKQIDKKLTKFYNSVN